MRYSISLDVKKLDGLAFNLDIKIHGVKVNEHSLRDHGSARVL